jgi:putative membrane protein
MIDYDPHKWFDHILDIKGSMLRQVFRRILACVLWAALVVYGNEQLKQRTSNEWSLQTSDRAHAFTGVVIGLLLVFRTNASYDRFWEGRRQWGSIINETRNLARAACVYLAPVPDVLRRLVHWTIAFPYATMLALRNQRGLAAAASLVPPVHEKGHLPLIVARRMTEQLAEARQRGVISDYVMIELDRNVQLLVDYLGACERIHRTPLPFAYVVHLRRVIIVYCYTLPFALLDTFGWGAVLVTLLLAFAFFGIEEIGVEIEDPFGLDDNDLPLERFCQRIEQDLSEMLASVGSAEEPQASGGR